MKFKQQLWAVTLPSKSNAEGALFEVVTLATGGNSTPALFTHKWKAGIFANKSGAAKIESARVVRVKVTIKVKKGGRK
jgi:hypothetical protein